MQERRKPMLYIFDKDDKFKNIITEDTGLIDTWFKDYQNHLIDEPFVFHVDAKSELLPLIVAENQVAFKHTFHALKQDVETLKLMRIKEIDEVYGNEGYMVRVQCEPSWLELYDHFIEDRRIDNGTANTAMSRALEGSRWFGNVVGEFGNGSTNFYWIDAVEALFKIAEEWSGTLQDYITLGDNNEIALRFIFLLPRLGRDNGLLIQPGYNAELIERRTLSYPITAIWGQGASLEIEDEDGNATGGHSRYITFEDVEWKVSNGDPVDKPKGQKWVGDPQALARYGYLKADGSRMHRFGHFSNQDYETPEELLYATWEALQKEKEPEIYHEAVIDEVDKPIFLGDTGTILDRHYGKPIEVQSQITGLEYDILKPTESVNIVLGNYKDMSRDPLEDEIDEIKKEQSRPPIINDNSFPDVKPGRPVNVEAVGMFRAILVSWEYDSKIYMSHYEVYASQMADFVPDAQFLVYRGRVSSFGHEVGSNETWYYRVRAVNTHGTTSEFSVQVSASSTRIDFIDMEDEIKQEIQDAKDRADEAHGNANIATENATEAINKAQEGFDKAQQALTEASGADSKAQQAIGKAQDSFDKALESLGKADESFNLAQDGFDKAKENAVRIDGLGFVIGDLEGDYTSISGTVQGLQTQVGNIEGDVTTVTQLANGLQTQISDAQGNINTLQNTAQGLSGRIESVNTRLDELDGDDRNLITHLPENWENGTISSTTGETTTNSTSWVRLVDYHPIKGGEVVTLSSYDDYNVYMYMYTENKAFVDYAQSSYDGSRTFTVSPDVRYFKIGIRNREATPIDPSVIGTELKTKLSYDDKRTDWTPNFNDTGELVNNVQKFVHEFSVTAEGLASRISDNQGNINQIANTVDGWQQTVSNLQGDVNTITNIASANQQKISSVEGSVSTLTQTADSLTSRLENIGGRNLVKNSRGDSLEGWVSWGTTNLSVTDYIDNTWIWAVKGDGNQVGLHTPTFDIKANEKYIISFTIRSRSNSGYQLNYLYLRAGKSTLTSVKRLPSVNMNNSDFKGDIAGDGLRVWFEISHGEDVEDARVLLAINDRPENAGFVIRELQVEQSEVLNPWSYAPEDADQKFSAINQTIDSIATRVQNGENNYSSLSQTVQGIQGTVSNVQGDISTVTQLANAHQTKISNIEGDVTAVTQTASSLRSQIYNLESDVNSSISQLNNAINLRVTKKDLINQINIDTSGILISGKKLILDGDTTVTGNFRVKNANIAEVDAGKITTGILNAANVTLINLRGLDIYGSRFRSSAGTDSMQIIGGNIELSLNNGRKLDISPTGFYGYNQGGSIRFQADASLVTSAAFGTSNGNVYLASMPAGEARVVNYNTLGGGGSFLDYTYRPIRASIYRFDNSAHGYFTLYGGGEFRFTGEDVANPSYLSVRMGRLYTSDIESRGDILYLRAPSRVRTYRTGSSSALIDLETKIIYNSSVVTNTANGYFGVDNELRVMNKGLSGVYRSVRAGKYFANEYEVNGGDILYLRAPARIRAMKTGSSTAYVPVQAEDFLYPSSKELKENITNYNNSAIEELRKLNIVEFDYINGGKSRVGVIAEDSKNIGDGKSVSIADTTFLNIKAIQELSAITNDLDLKIDLTREELVLKIAQLEQRINELESAA